MSMRIARMLSAAIVLVSVTLALAGCGNQTADPEKDKINQTPQMKQLRAQKTDDK